MKDSGTGPLRRNVASADSRSSCGSRKKEWVMGKGDQVGGRGTENGGMGERRPGEKCHG